MGIVRRPHTSKHSPAKVKTAERQRAAMQLRGAGATYAQIARELGYSDARGAERAVIAGLRAAGREASEDLLPLELDRLDRLQLAIWPQAIDGDVPSVLAVLRIMERRARYAGLDAPTRASLTLDAHQTIDARVGVMVIQGAKNEYIESLRAMRGEGPLPIEGRSSVQDGQLIDMAQPAEGMAEPVAEPLDSDDA